jgi:SAM-dependent methyltransferase
VSREAAEFYSEHADRFAEKYTEDMLGEEYFGYMDSFAELAGGKVLDAGCGPGRDADLLMERGLEVLGVDLSERMVEIARERNEAEFEVADITELEFEEEFGGVWCSSAIFFLDREGMSEALECFMEALKPGRPLYINFKQGDGFVEKERWEDSVRELRVSEDEARELLEKVGFEVVEFQRAEVPHSTAYLNFICRKP